MKTKFCQGISDIADTYVGFVVDQWGVLHDGATAYAGAAECLVELKAQGKFIIVLSNSGKRAAQNALFLESIGITPAMYDVVITSGEMTWQGLSQQNIEPFCGLGQACYIISRGGDKSLVAGIEGLHVVDDIDSANFLLISGTDAPEKTLVDYEPILRAAVRRGLRALCANPDSKAIMGMQHIMGPGTLARRYKDFGGVVHYIGKPHIPIYRLCFNILREKEIYPAQTVMIGDSMTHDILGGSTAGIDTCLAKGGLHAGHFRTAHSPADVDKALTMLCAQYNNVRPTYLIDRFIWGRPLESRKNKQRKG